VPQRQASGGPWQAVEVPDELRPKGRTSTGRAFYGFMQDRRVVIVHAFVKKTRTTPRRDIAIARQRIKEIQRGWTRT
jgi:phage-related protein